MSKIFIEILDEHRKKIWNKLKNLPKGGILGGGTALALQIAHRKSYDFDIFYKKPISKNILLKIKKLFGNDFKKILVDTGDELSFIVNPDIKITLLYYPFQELFSPIKTSSISIFNINDLASDKAYCIGRRGVWRDYVDMFFLLKNHLNLKTVMKNSKKKFKELFNEKLFLQQLEYFEDLGNFSIEFLSNSVPQKEIKNFFKNEVATIIRTFFP